MGRVMPGYEAKIVDEDDDELPDGTAGELVLRADEPFAFATGYWRMPEQTVESWRNLWFHSGDRAVRDPDGSFRFLDRMKDAIRRRGENISAWEVEQVLQSHPDVAAAAVVPVPSELGEDEVMAFVVLRDGRRQLDPVELIRHCEPRLAYFAIPRYLDIVDELPLTENGKVRKFVAARARRDRDDLGSRGRRATSCSDERGPQPTASEWLRRLRAAASCRRVELAEHRSALLDAADARAERGRRARRRGGAARRGRGRPAHAPPATTGPLLGLPVTIKDSLAVAGLPVPLGLGRARAPRRRERRDGRRAAPRGRARSCSPRRTVPEYVWSYETESVAPRADAQRLRPGADERAARAAARARCSARTPRSLGIGTDGGGSIRVPSHYNGIVGLRPSVRLVPETGCWPTSRDTGMLDMVCVGPMGRSVDDVALSCSARSPGRDGVDPFVGVEAYVGRSPRRRRLVAAGRVLCRRTASGRRPPRRRGRGAARPPTRSPDAGAARGGGRRRRRSRRRPTCSSG